MLSYPKYNEFEEDLKEQITIFETILEKLANDDEGFVRCAVAKNLNIPGKILERLENN